MEEKPASETIAPRLVVPLIFGNLAAAGGHLMKRSPRRLPPRLTCNFDL